MVPHITTGPCPSAGPAIARPAPGMLELAARALGTWLERRRQRRALAGLSDAMLKDIGVTRAAAEHEAGKPFWQG
jgi:uncharacterized protein YjiS (DUF1127 family)